jgi:hypothetical protein
MLNRSPLVKSGLWRQASCDPQATFTVLTDDRPLPTVEATVEKVGQEAAPRPKRTAASRRIR